MAGYPVYRFTLKSAEQLAASQMNTLYLGLASTDDVSTFATNVENIFSAYVASIDWVLSTDYELPYPDGTDIMWRVVLRDAQGRVQTINLNDVSPEAVPTTFAAALTGSDILLYPYGTPVKSVQISVFEPGAYPTPV
jgi:hypothetical protein